MFILILINFNVAFTMLPIICKQERVVGGQLPGRHGRQRVRQVQAVEGPRGRVAGWRHRVLDGALHVGSALLESAEARRNHQLRYQVRCFL